MGQDDPEKRIAELERQLAELRPAGEPGANQGSKTAGGCLTPEQVRNVAFSKPPLGKRGYNEAEVDAFLDRVEAALARLTESHTFAMRVNEESAASAEPIRCVLRPYPYPSVWKRQPLLLIDMSKDAIWVSDPNTNTLIASAGLAHVTATPAGEQIYVDHESEFFGGWHTRPLLVVRVPGLQPLIITTSPMKVNPIQYGLSWRGAVVKAKKPGHLVTRRSFVPSLGSSAWPRTWKTRRIGLEAESLCVHRAHDANSRYPCALVFGPRCGHLNIVHLERWWFLVSVGLGRSGVARALGPLGGAGIVVLAAFGGDAVGAVLGAGAAAFGHHRGALAAGVGWWVGVGGWDPAGGQAQAGEQQRAARGGDVGVPGR
jgi:DivIVA domain-containing protein